MSEPIKVGDLVMIVKPRDCCDSAKLGKVFRVGAIEGGPGRCANCGNQYEDILDAQQEGLEKWVHVSRLKRIPPYSQLEHFRTEELLRRDVKEKA